MKASGSLTTLAARRLVQRHQVDLEARAAPVQKAMRDAMVRLDWREVAGRQLCSTRWARDRGGR